MKYISFAIPCFNSAAYMEHAIETILIGGEDVEIIIVDDGSKDETATIAKRYAEQYPTIIKAVSQENSGHGGAVNTGLEHATGLYFKVVDSDDWVDETAYRKILTVVKEMAQKENPVDMLLANYVYEKVGAKKKKIVRYPNIPQEKVIGWDEVGKFGLGSYIVMHSVMYRTEMLKECGLRLPKHMFYVDNVFVYYPLPYVKSIYYVDVDFYRYYLGRDDQSVNEVNLIKRIDQQYEVVRVMIDSHDLQKLPNQRLHKYMVDYLSILMTICCVIAVRSKNPENDVKKQELWEYLRKSSEATYQEVKKTGFGRAVSIPGWIGRKVVVCGYLIAKKLGFN